MRRYDLSRHSENVISERYIRLAWLERVLDSPELVEADRDDPELMHHVGGLIRVPAAAIAFGRGEPRVLSCVGEEGCSGVDQTRRVRWIADSSAKRTTRSGGRLIE
jgi:hypothetical protein